MADTDDTNSRPKPTRTRKAEIISGASLGVLLALYGAQREFRNDLESGFKDRVDAVVVECRAAIAAERDRAQERERLLDADIRELRTQTLTLRGRR